MLVVKVQDLLDARAGRGTHGLGAGNIEALNGKAGCCVGGHRGWETGGPGR